MKSFSCGLVVPNCTAKFTGETEEDVLAQVADHARRDHGMSDVPTELVDQVRSHIQEF
jgi:predicted small metal-binding protein